MEIRNYIMAGGALLAFIGCGAIHFEKIAGAVCLAVGGATFIGAFAYPKVKKALIDHIFTKQVERRLVQSPSQSMMNAAPDEEDIDEVEIRHHKN